MTLLEAENLTRPMTLAEFERLAEQDRYELLNGRLVELQMGMESDLIANAIATLLLEYARRTGRGIATGQTAYKLVAVDGAEHLLKPDASYIAWSRLPGGQVPRGYCNVAPDLAVEVLSPRDLAEHVEEKTAEYLSLGVTSVWSVYPPGRFVRVHRSDGSVAEFRPGQRLKDDPAMPGFDVDVADFFSILPPASA
jgi:Uma2 family endonuclease